MLLHCTKRLATKLPKELFTGSDRDDFEARDSGLGEWHGHLLILDRRQCVLFCHDVTRYVLFFPGLRAPQFADIGRWHRELFLATLAVEKVSSHRLRLLDATCGNLRVDTETDRSVLGSLRVAADELQYGFLPRVANVLDLNPVATSCQLNERPCMVGKTLIWPVQAMLKLTEEADQRI